MIQEIKLTAYIKKYGEHWADENSEIVEVDVCSNRGSGSLDYHYQSLLPQVAHDRQRVDANNASAFCRY